MRGLEPSSSPDLLAPGPAPVCKRPACANSVRPSARGRPAEYCGAACRQLFNREKEHLKLELARVLRQCALYGIDPPPADATDAHELALSQFTYEVELVRAVARDALIAADVTALSRIEELLNRARDRVYARLASSTRDAH